MPDAAGYLEHADGDALELELTVDLRRTRARRFGAGVRLSRDGRGARVWYEPAGNRIGVDRLLGPEQVYANPAATRRGDLQGAVGKLQAAQVTAPARTVHGESGSVTLRLFVDRSILEVYCGGAALTDRLYPEPSATGVDLYAEGRVAHVKAASVWPLRGTWQPQLPVRGAQERRAARKQRDSEEPNRCLRGRRPGDRVSSARSSVDETPAYPHIPYGQADFRRICLNRWLYVDKTRFLRRLEQEHYAFLIRPRRFGKSLWVSLLGNYYDRFWADDFDATFAGTDFGQDPTEERSRYVTLRFNFSMVNDKLERWSGSSRPTATRSWRGRWSATPTCFPKRRCSAS